MHSMKKLVRIVIIILQLIFVCAILFPIFFMFKGIHISYFYELLIEKFWFYPKFWNSFILAFVVGLGATIISLFSAVSLKWGNFKYKRIILSLLLLLMLMPLQVTLLPNYIGLRDLGLLDTESALILPMICSPFAVYLMYQYMETVSMEGFEAARLETDSFLKILAYIILPQMRACFAAVFVFMFAEGFNMVEQPLYFVKKDSLKPLSVLKETLQQGEEHLINVVGIICMIPLLLLYGFYEEEITEGLGNLRL